MQKTSGQIERERIAKRNEIVIKNYAICYFCKSRGLTESDGFCPNCGFPQGGSQSEMKRFLVIVKKKKELLKDKKNAVKKARNILFILAGMNFAFGLIISLVQIFSPLDLILYGIVSGIYLSLGLWSLHRPFAAILSGFFVYITFNVADAIVDPHTLYQGIIWKIIFIYFFVYGYRSVKQAELLEQELSELKQSRNLTVSDDL